MRGLVIGRLGRGRAFIGAGKRLLRRADPVGQGALGHGGRGRERRRGHSGEALAQIEDQVPIAVGVAAPSVSSHTAGVGDEVFEHRARDRREVGLWGLWDRWGGRAARWPRERRQRA